MTWTIRTEQSSVPQYYANNFLFSIEYHHGGKFIKNGDKIVKYIDGLKDYFDYCDPRDMQITSLGAMGNFLGWIDVKKFYFKRVGSEFSTDVCEIKHDSDVVNLGKFVNIDRVVEVYAEECTSYLESDTSDDEGITDKVQDKSFDMFSGSEDDGGEDDGLVDLTVNYEDNFEPGTSSKCVPIKKKHSTTDNLNNEDVVNAVNENGADSDHFNSDGEDQGVVFGNADLSKVKFELGMKFGTAEHFKEAVRMYSFQNGKDIKFKKNTKKKLSCYCNNSTKNGGVEEKECKWYLYASTVRDELTIQIKTFRDDHTCPRTQEISACKPKFLARKFEEMIRMNPKWPITSFQQTVAKQLQCQVKLPKAYKAFKLAKTKVQGNAGEQYLVLYDYIEEIKRTNAETTVIMKVAHRPNQEIAIFRRIYICWGALKKGFMQGCRPVIGFDGCHLSGPHRGILLSAVAIDPNNCMYPFSYAVVDTESYATWKWFIKLVCVDLNIQNPADYTIISDKQKGLIKAVDKLLPGVEHRFCVRHLYNNFNVLHKGIALKKLLEKAARATTMADFESALEDMKNLDKEAYLWLSSKPGMNWSRSHFSTHTKCALILNNLCESFNACIKEYRVKPILSMLEDIRVKLMDMVMRKKMAIDRCTNLSICPNIRKKIDTLKLSAHDWHVVGCGDNKFEVTGVSGKRFSCNLQDRTCGCNWWQLSGIPCVHAISCIYYQNHEPEDYVHQCYSIETYKQVYSNFLVPMNGQEQWPKTLNKPKVLPPPIRDVKLGRPPKVRRRGPNEPKLTHIRRTGLIMKCKKCGKPGHNSRTCGKEKPVRVQGKGIKKRAQKSAPIGLVDEDNSASSADDREKAGEPLVNVEVVSNEFVVNETVQDERVRNEEVQNEGVGMEWAWEMGSGVRSDVSSSQPVMATYHETHQKTRKMPSSQPLKCATKLKVRRSTRIMNSPKKGPTIVDFHDLTEAEPQTIHAGILKAAKGLKKLPKGQLQRGGKRYITHAALVADMEFKKKGKIA